MVGMETLKIPRCILMIKHFSTDLQMSDIYFLNVNLK